MTQFIELTQRRYDSQTRTYLVGKKFLMDFHSGWEIIDEGDEPAHWVNQSLGMNHAVAETYKELKYKLKAAGLSYRVIQSFCKEVFCIYFTSY